MAAAPILFMADAIVAFRLPPGVGTAVEFQAHCTTAEVMPTPGDEQAVVTLDGERHVRYGASSYVLHLVVKQDWSSTGFSRWLFDNHGSHAGFSITAYTAGGATDDTPGIGGECIITEGSYGGEVETWIESDIELPIMGRPGLVTGAPLLATRGYDVRVRSWPEPRAETEPEPAQAA